MINVMIAIQARSTSTRLPGKSFELVEKQTMTEHVIAACQSAADHVNRAKKRFPAHVQVVLLVPEGDPLRAAFMDKVEVVEGPEDDVLTRFVIAYDKMRPDFIVRITGDCCLITPPIISKHILCSLFDNLDYCSNVDENYRTYVDGYDVECMSAEVLKWLDEHARSGADREHVTTQFRRNPPEWAKIGQVIGFIDLSDVKLSVDTQDDLTKVRENKRAITEKLNKARRNGHQIYRF